jgi:hypothetical protein
MKICLAGKYELDLILPFRLLEKIRNLSKPIIIANRSNTIYRLITKNAPAYIFPI